MRDSILTSFLELGLSEPIARALSDEQYALPTPIQAQTIPQVLSGRDVIGIAQTGTGKTAAFALPILDHIAKTKKHPDKRTCRVLVLSPTRELSAQIVDSFQTYGRYLKPRTALAIGGVPINRQVRTLVSGVDVLVATPGRLLDLIQMGAVRLDRIEVFVLDEADRMLDMGFIQDIRTIVAKLPSNRQTLFFSATMPPPISDLAGAMLHKPVRIAVTPSATTVERIDQRVILVDKAGKPKLLADLLRQEPIDRALVFTRTKHGADRVVNALAKSGIDAGAIHGNKSQSQRERALAAFRTGQIRILIATDIAARGIDVDGISHVVNFDLPNIPESYVHRIGRTARAGADGIAISFCDAEERAYLRDIERLIKRAIPASDQRRARQDGQSQDKPEPKSERHNERRKASQRTRRKPVGKSAERRDERRDDRSAPQPGNGFASVGFMRNKPPRRPRHGGAKAGANGTGLAAR